MKKVSLIILLSCICRNSQAQLKHYFSVNSVLYADFFNPENDKLSNLKKLLTSPCVSYKLERQNWGIEVYLGQAGMFYHRLEYGQIKKADISQIFLYSIGVNLQYCVLENDFIKINPFFGLAYNHYDAMVFDAWFTRPFPHGFLHTEEEKKIGLQTGVNINIPIFKGIYTNSNVRYTAIPGAKYNRQNLLVEIGLGHMLQRKKIVK